MNITVITTFKNVFSWSLSWNSSSPKRLIIILSGFSEEKEKYYMHLSHLNIDIKYIYLCMAWYEIQNSANGDPSHFHLKFELPKTEGSLVTYSSLSQVN